MKLVGAVVRGQDLVSVDPAVSVAEAARLMAARQIGAVPVVAGDQVVGIFSERDVVTRVVAVGLDPGATPVGNVMSSSLVVAQVGEGADVCLSRMKQAGIRHLIVLDRGRMAGIVSMRDLIAVDLDDKVETIALLSAYVGGGASGISYERS